MTNGNGGSQTPASGLPLNGGGGLPPGGPLAVGAGQGGQGAAPFQSPPGHGNLPVPASEIRRVPAPAPAPAPRKGSRMSISNWRVRWRLIAIITVPTVTALILGVIQIVGSVNNYSSFKRVQNLANLNALVVQGAGQLADERDDTAGYVAAGGQSAAAPASLATLSKQVQADQQATNVTVGQISSAAQAVVNGDGYRSQTVL